MHEVGGRPLIMTMLSACCCARAAVTRTTKHGSGQLRKPASQQTRQRRGRTRKHGRSGSGAAVVILNDRGPNAMLGVAPGCGLLRPRPHQPRSLRCGE